MRDRQVVFQEIIDLSQQKNWIMEGVFGELAEITLNAATVVIFLDKSWDECKSSLVIRGSESAQQTDPVQAEESFKQLLLWAENYWSRTGLRSHAGHQNLFDKAQCRKIKVKSRDEMDEALRTALQ